MLIHIERLERIYRKGSVQIHALRQVNLDLREGEFTAIMGPSGSGKSTLLHIIGCLDRPSNGLYRLDDIDVSQVTDQQRSRIRNQKIGFVFQSFNLLPQHTVLQNIETPLLYRPEKSDDVEFSRRGRAEEVARQVGLEHRFQHLPSELSGGEMQRVAIARALVGQPRVILADEPTGNLDSRTGQDIMQILKRLHQQGHTVVIVTHERAVAAYTDRVMYMQDGLIQQDIRRQSAVSPSLSSKPSLPSSPSKTAASDGEQRFDGEKTDAFTSLVPKFINLTRIALNGILLHRLRSLLSILGIVFGIGAIIAMLAIGAGAKQEIVEQIALLGTNTLTVKAVPPSEESLVTERHQRSAGLTADDVERLRAISPFLTHLAPVREFSLPVHAARQSLPARILGTTPAYQYTRSLTLQQGRFLTEADEAEMQRVCVVGAELHHALFALHKPLGQLIKIRGDWFRVIGTLENKTLHQSRVAALQSENINRTVFIPFATSTTFAPQNTVDAIQQISMRVDAPEHVDDVAMLTRTVLNRLHHGAEDYEVIVPRELLKQSQQAQRIFNIVMGCIAGISLLVGGIGIMNIMLATVTERTREIGIRRAIGATQRIILAQFLIETLLLTLVGGVFGILLGVGGAYAISLFARWRTIISLPTILFAVGISALIGIVFGVYPASQGANMDPIAALRYE